MCLVYATRGPHQTHHTVPGKGVTENVAGGWRIHGIIAACTGNLPFSALGFWCTNTTPYVGAGLGMYTLLFSKVLARYTISMALMMAESPVAPIKFYFYVILMVQDSIYFSLEIT